MIDIPTSVRSWYDKSRIDYTDQFMRLFVAYAIWFRGVTGKTTDRHAIESLKKRFVIWDEYYQDKAMIALKPIAANIAKMTSTDGLIKTKVADADDWRQIIEYWYEVRCHIFHGNLTFGETYSHIYVKLAYDSLSIFMDEIVRRMEQTFSKEDGRRMSEIKEIIQSGGSRNARIARTEQMLYAKFINSTEWWNVDMVRTGY